MGSHQVSLATGRRACRRQVNTCCGVSPFRRATSETIAPGTSVSSTIPALKSSENWRRRPVPVITSSRRSVVASGLSVWSSVDTSRSPIQRSHNRKVCVVADTAVLLAWIGLRFGKSALGEPGLFPLERVTGIARARAICASVGAAVTAAEERPKPIVQTNFKHLNLAARRESVPPERPRSKREVIQFDKVILKLR